MTIDDAVIWAEATLGDWAFELDMINQQAAEDGCSLTEPQLDRVAVLEFNMEALRTLLNKVTD